MPCTDSARARVKDSFTAEDLVQETLLAAYRSRKKFSGRSTLKTWLIGILRHKIVDYYRKQKPEQGEENPDDFVYGSDNMFDAKEKWKVKPGDWGKDPENEYERKELMTVIHACLDEMPKKMSLAYTCANCRVSAQMNCANSSRHGKITAGSSFTGQECYSGAVLKQIGFKGQSRISHHAKLDFQLSKNISSDLRIHGSETTALSKNGHQAAPDDVLPLPPL